MERALRLLKFIVAAAIIKANTEKARFCKTLDKMSELQALVEMIDWRIGDEQSGVVRLVYAALVCIRSFNTVAL